MNGEHGAPHRAVRVDLILDADEANAEMVELLQCRQQVTRTAGKAIELPDQDTIDLAVPDRGNQRVQLRSAFSSS
jgi:hypothetical protein